MERPQDPGEERLERRSEDGEGEDHREGQPGYDLDEQRAIEELERERDKGD